MTSDLEALREWIAGRRQEHMDRFQRTVDHTAGSNFKARVNEDEVILEMIIRLIAQRSGQDE